MNEVPLMPLWVTVGLLIWGVIGPFVGLLIGHFLSVSSQRNHWIADNAKEEYRELLSALFDAGNMAVLHRSLGREATFEEVSAEERSDHHLYMVLHTRLFIRDFVENEKIMERWSKCFAEYGESQDLEMLRKSLRDLIEFVANAGIRLKN
jgi:hypothetical protein